MAHLGKQVLGKVPNVFPNSEFICCAAFSQQAGDEAVCDSQVIGPRIVQAGNSGQWELWQ